MSDATDVPAAGHGAFVSNSLLYTDLYELTMAQAYLATGQHDSPACFDYFFRQTPFGGGYVLFAGLHDLLDEIEALRIDEAGLAFLEAEGFSAAFLDLLKGFCFSGSIHAPREGEVVFPGEPLLRVEAPLWEAQLIESLLLSFLNFQSLVATKTSRVCQAAAGRPVLDFALRRANGSSGLMASRAALIGGAAGTSNVLAAQRYGVPAVGTMAHAWVQSHDSEYQAFADFLAVFPERGILLVDSYDTLRSGVRNAIALARALGPAGTARVSGIRLDSGDLAWLSREARRLLDEASFPDIRIVASNQLDEYVIRSLLEQDAPIDVFGVGSGLLGGGRDGASVLDGVYKLAANAGRPRMKLSENPAKTTLPGPKQVLRLLDDEGRFQGDAVVCAEQTEVPRMLHPQFPDKQLDLRRFQQEPLLRPVLLNGRRVQPAPSIQEIHRHAAARLEQLPAEYRRFEYPHLYKVGVSEELHALQQKLRRELLGAGGS